ncbi:YheC/YheD family endospore coat-associated protein [Neobacillus ginsengisoli]|uniref:YheC/YheD family protein n=1 Tax=Neobacillus ginsengisoli TaxID=904295 RepID=A0ABT9XPW2_9BACI|nr:YheC/YheD family protein [Neobacillus ginsengisoli]MDQ0197583.1 hypothetical protein [Neobacillus ginsengisoli]
MDERCIGIFLSRHEWKRLIQKQTDNCQDAIFYQYAKRGEELDIEVLFFNSDHLVSHELKGNALCIKDNTIIEKGFVRIPSIVYNSIKYNRKKMIRNIIDLAQNPGFYVINERNNIKKKHLFDLLETQKELQQYIAKEEQQTIAPIIFQVVGQKGIRHKWKLPILYAKDSDNKIFSFDEAYNIIFNKKIKKEELKAEIYKVSQKILKILHYYYPGEIEIGLQFIIKDTGEIQLKSTNSIFTIVKDLHQWNDKLYRKIVNWPIDLANSIRIIKGQKKDLILRNSLIDDIGKNELKDDTSNKVNFSKEAYSKKMNFWVKFKTFQDNEMTIKIPDRVGNLLQKSPTSIKLGVKEEPCQCIVFKDAIPLRNNSYHQPIDIFISESLVNKMHLPLDLVYQIQFSNKKAVIGPTIGFLLGEKNQLYNLSYMEKYCDRFGEYDTFGGLTIAFSPRSVDWNEKIAYGMIYDPLTKEWRYDSAPIPSAIYRRNFHQNKESIKRLIEWTEGNLFNSYHFKKSDLLLLKNEPEIKDHLPTTFLLQSIDDLIDFINKKQKIILKPVSLSRGRGIFILEKNLKTGKGFILYDYRNNSRIEHIILDRAELEESLDNFGILTQGYLFQTYIPLLKVNNRAFDVRVVMQKYNKMKWKCSGIECRVARENDDLTNIARGGEGMSLETVLKKSTQGLSYSNVYKSIIKLCQSFCYLMNKGDEHFAEFGLDIALDENGFPWILEANIYPSFKGFKELDYETYLKIRYQPLFYAVQIQGFKILDSAVKNNSNSVGKFLF